ncbi:MAG: hypothetical protein Q9170_003796 [Blastenia crenularia]
MFETDQLLPEDLPRNRAGRRALNDYSVDIQFLLAGVLTANGMPCDVIEVGDTADYTKWNVTLDASLSDRHLPDHFCKLHQLHPIHHRSLNLALTVGLVPLEVISPKIIADGTWVQVIDVFWSVLLAHFELRQGISCGLHIHISTVTGSYSMNQLRAMAKAIIVWEPATKRCTPPSRHDRFQLYCKSNVAHGVPVAEDLNRGLAYAFDKIDDYTRDDIIGYICPEKHMAWNLLPSRTDGHGSIEFRRPPGVVTAKKAKHWIAFAMAFVDMAIQFDPSALAPQIANNLAGLYPAYHPDFRQQFLACARQLGVYAILDARLSQTDEPWSLHITEGTLKWYKSLHDFDPNYKLGPNASPSLLSAFIE